MERGKMYLTRYAYNNYIDENTYKEYENLLDECVGVIYNGFLLREYNDKKVFKLECDNSYILVTLTDNKRITNIIERGNKCNA